MPFSSLWTRKTDESDEIIYLHAGRYTHFNGIKYPLSRDPEQRLKNLFPKISIEGGYYKRDHSDLIVEDPLNPILCDDGQGRGEFRDVFGPEEEKPLVIGPGRIFGTYYKRYHGTPPQWTRKGWFRRFFGRRERIVYSEYFGEEEESLSGSNPLQARG
jgi:hypothetical protein